MMRNDLPGPITDEERVRAATSEDLVDALRPRFDAWLDTVEGKPQPSPRDRESEWTPRNETLRTVSATAIAHEIVKRYSNSSFYGYHMGVEADYKHITGRIRSLPAERPIPAGQVGALLDLGEVIDTVGRRESFFRGKRTPRY